MLINGRKISGPNIELIVIPRGDTEIVFKAEAVLDFEPFRKLCPAPKPPEIMKRGEGIVLNVEDPFYKKEVEQYNNKRVDWMVITSLRATDGLQWESVKYEDPSTWASYKDELRESGFGEYETNRIINGVMRANSLDESKIEEARKRFLLGQQQHQPNSSSQKDAQNNTPSGEPANGSISSLPVS